MTNAANTHRFSFLNIPAGDERDLARLEALTAHDATLLPGVKVRVYRGNWEGFEGAIVEELDRPHWFSVISPDGMIWETVSVNLELV